MPTDPDTRRRPSITWAKVLVGGIALVATVWGGAWWSSEWLTRPATQTPAPSSASGEAWTPVPGPLVDPRGEPVRVVLTSATRGVLADASVVGAHTDADGRLSPPAGRAGWLADTGWPRPGVESRYRSILTGHVSANGRDDTFARLSESAIGDRVEITYDSGDIVRLVIAVDPVSVGKTTVTSDPGFDWVWENPGAHPARVVSLVTCNPASEHIAGHSVDNWVTQASVVAVITG